MLRQVTGTIASRVFVTLMNLLVIMLAGHRLGAEGLGVISLIVLGITLIMLPANLIGGGSLVYLVPRVPLLKLLKPAYAWAVISACVAFPLLRTFPLVPSGVEVHVVALALMQALYSIHLSVLIGQQRILQHNAITALQALVLLVTFIMAANMGDHAHVIDYVWASYASFGSTLLLSAFAMRWNTAPIDVAPRSTVRFMLKQGAMVQGANAMQLVNYRLAYWLIEHFQGKAALGLYSVGNQLAESAWLAPKSLGLVLYSKISNLPNGQAGTPNDEQQRTLTLTIMKLAVACAIAVLLVMLALPDIAYRTAFGHEITGLRPIALLLAPGIICMAASQAFSHYFSGTARNKHNVIGSGLGLLITVALGFALIPRFALHGAAIAASCAYAANVIYQAVVFMRGTRSSVADLLPTARDVERARELLKRLSLSS